MEWWGWLIWAFLLYFGFYLAKELFLILKFNIDRFRDR